jgi:hypothetical protein
MDKRYPLDPRKVDEIVWSLQDILNEPQLYTASGRGVRSPATSVARLPGVELVPRSGGGAASGVSNNMLKNPTYEQTRMSDVSKELQKARIDQILSKIDLNLPSPAPEPSIASRVMGYAGEAASRAAPFVTLLDMLSYSPELNAGEQEELTKRRKLNPTIDR